MVTYFGKIDALEKALENSSITRLLSAQYVPKPTPNQSKSAMWQERQAWRRGVYDRDATKYNPHAPLAQYPEKSVVGQSVDSSTPAVVRESITAPVDELRAARSSLVSLLDMRSIDLLSQANVVPHVDSKLSVANDLYHERSVPAQRVVASDVEKSTVAAQLLPTYREYTSFLQEQFSFYQRLLTSRRSHQSSIEAVVVAPVTRPAPVDPVRVSKRTLVLNPLENHKADSKEAFLYHTPDFSTEAVSITSLLKSGLRVGAAIASASVLAITSYVFYSESLNKRIDASDAATLQLQTDLTSRRESFIKSEKIRARLREESHRSTDVTSSKQSQATNLDDLVSAHTREALFREVTTRLAAGFVLLNDYYVLPQATQAMKLDPTLQIDVTPLNPIYKINPNLKKNRPNLSEADVRKIIQHFERIYIQSKPILEKKHAITENNRLAAMRGLNLAIELFGPPELNRPAVNTLARKLVAQQLGLPESELLELLAFQDAL